MLAANSFYALFSAEITIAPVAKFSLILAIKLGE